MKKLMLIAGCALVLGGCSTSSEELLPTSGETMQDIWNNGGSYGAGNSTQLLEARSALQFVRAIDSPYSNAAEMQHYTRTAANEATNLFPRLPNPDLVMYVFPHLTTNEEPVPVPGYTTVFPFYGRVQYAQPGERVRDY